MLIQEEESGLGISFICVRGQEQCPVNTFCLKILLMDRFQHELKRGKVIPGRSGLGRDRTWDLVPRR